MANKSDWKGFEKMVATALGGKRRFRTMENAGSYATKAPDVYFPKKIRRKFPKVKTVVVECKKRRGLNVHLLFAEAVSKYGEDGKHLILASKTPRGKLGRDLEKLKSKIEKRYRVGGPIWKRLLKKLKTKGKAKARLGRKMKRALKFETARLKAKHSIVPLVTVELSFFKELWDAWRK